MAGRLWLGAELEPGEYVSQVVVSAPPAEGKYRTAAQWIDFELRRRRAGARGSPSVDFLPGSM